jgi:hypothetical protein
MAFHYTQGTESVTKWCNVCQRMTQFAVSGGRVGRCTEHQAPKFSKAQLHRQKLEELDRRKGPRLF